MKKPPQIKSFRYQDVFAELRSVLIAAMSEREARSALVDAEPEWVEFERSMMTLAVDRIRAAQGLAPADPALILRAEPDGCSCSTADVVQRCKTFGYRVIPAATKEVSS